MQNATNTPPSPLDTLQRQELRALRPQQGVGVIWTRAALPATPEHLERLRAAWSFEQ